LFPDFHLAGLPKELRHRDETYRETNSTAVLSVVVAKTGIYPLLSPGGLESLGPHTIALFLSPEKSTQHFCAPAYLGASANLAR